MSFNTQAEQTYDMFPVQVGIAKEQVQWATPLDWLLDKHSEEYAFCMDYHIDNDQVQDRHQSEMDEDGFFDSDATCDIHNGPISAGAALYRMTYSDGSTQEPICLTCAKECMEELAQEVSGSASILLTAKIVADKLERPYWEVLAWIIAQEVADDALIVLLDEQPDALRRWILCDLRIGAAIW